MGLVGRLLLHRWGGRSSMHPVSSAHVHSFLERAISKWTVLMFWPLNFRGGKKWKVQHGRLLGAYISPGVVFAAFLTVPISLPGPFFPFFFFWRLDPCSGVTWGLSWENGRLSGDRLCWRDDGLDAGSIQIYVRVSRGGAVPSRGSGSQATRSL